MLPLLLMHSLLLTSSPGSDPSLAARSHSALLQVLPAGVELQVKQVHVQGTQLPGAELRRVEVLAAPLRGHARLRLSYLGRQGRLRTRWARADVRLCGTIWVASKDLRAGATLATGDLLQQRRCDIDAEQLLEAMTALQGARLRRGLRVGESLRKGDLRPAPLVQRGEIVRLIWQQAGIEISGEAEALDAAMQGQSLRLRRHGGEHYRGKILRGVAIAPATVEIR